MPAEWEPHAGTWVTWPERPDNWRLGGKPAQAAFTTVIDAIADHELVTVLVSRGQFVNARNRLPGNVRVIETSTDDAWIRDIGASFVVGPHGEVRGVDWTFNAWGGLVDGLYFPWDDDDLVARKMCDIERLDYYRTNGFVLEGGSIDVDGQGTVLTTEECLLSAGRNRTMSQDEIERTVLDYLGASKMIWLPEGIYLDETDGHVDNICRFVAPGKVILAWTDDESDPQFKRSLAALQALEETTDARGRHLEVVKVHQPNPILITEQEARGVDVVPGSQPRTAGERLAGSYVNSYFAHGIIVLPVFDDPHDLAAVETYKRLFPERVIVTVPGREILLGGGDVHCITQQQPAGR